MSAGQTVILTVTTGEPSVFTLLADLRRYAAEHSLLLVANGCSSKQCRELRAALPKSGELLFLSENRGGSGGFAHGMRYFLEHFPKANRLWLLDDDVRITDSTLEELSNAASLLTAQNQKWGAIASMMLETENPDIVTETGATVNWWRAGLNAYNRGKKASDILVGILPVDYGAAASLLINQEAISEIGFFENVFLHFDDVDWCFRLKRIGYKVYCAPQSKIWHPTNRSKPATWVRYYDARNFIWLCTRHNKKFLLWAILLLTIKGLYFYSHGLKKTGWLYFSGIRDAFSSKLAMRSELQYEDYSSIDKTIFQKYPLICIFNSPDHFQSFQDNCRPERIAKVFLYQSNPACEQKQFLPMMKKIASKLILGLKSCVYCSVCSRNSIVVIDDAFRNNFIFPAISRRKLIYNCYLNQFVKLKELR